MILEIKSVHEFKKNVSNFFEKCAKLKKYSWNQKDIHEFTKCFELPKAFSDLKHVHELKNTKVQKMLVNSQF